MRQLAIRYVRVLIRFLYKILGPKLNRYSTYIDDKGVWIITSIFSRDINGLFGVTDVFRGDESNVDTKVLLHSVYIEDNTSARKTHIDTANDVDIGRICIEQI